MSKAQLTLAGLALVILGVLAETLILKGQAPSAMQIATGVIGALNLAGVAGQIASRVTTPSATITTSAKEAGS